MSDLGGAHQKVCLYGKFVSGLRQSAPACKDKGERGGQVYCEDRVAEEGGREEATEGFEVDEAVVVHRGDGEGGMSVNRGTVANVLYGGDNLLDGEK